MVTRAFSLRLSLLTTTTQLEGQGREHGVAPSGYKKEDLDEALDRAFEKAKFAAVARTSSVPLRTLFKKAKELQTTGTIVKRRRGPKPALSVEQETGLVAWVAGMQHAGFPVGLARVLKRAN